MAGTFSQIYIQVVFAVKDRANLIAPAWETSLYEYMAGIIRAKGQKPIIINGMPNHVHVFMGLRPVMAIADMVRDIKNNSFRYINERGFLKQRFCWQEGYGCFSYSHSHIQRVYNYILHQKAHHEKRTFKAEYLEMLERFKVEYDERYLFEWNE
jgi:putative transposase